MKVYRAVYNCVPDEKGHLTKEGIGLRLLEILLAKKTDSKLLDWLNVEELEVE